MLLAAGLLECYKRDWECAPPGLSTELLERVADPAGVGRKGTHDQVSRLASLLSGELSCWDAG